MIATKIVLIILAVVLIGAIAALFINAGDLSREEERVEYEHLRGNYDDTTKIGKE